MSPYYTSTCTYLPFLYCLWCGDISANLQWLSQFCAHSCLVNLGSCRCETWRSSYPKNVLCFECQKHHKFIHLLSRAGCPFFWPNGCQLQQLENRPSGQKKISRISMTSSFLSVCGKVWWQPALITPAIMQATIIFCQKFWAWHK